MEIDNVIRARVGCPGPREALLDMLYRPGRVKMYDEMSDGQAAWAYRVKLEGSGATEIWISDGHWVGGILDEAELGETMRHEGVHEWLDEPLHTTSFWSQVQTCYPN